MHLRPNELHTELSNAINSTAFLRRCLRASCVVYALSEEGGLIMSSFRPRVGGSAVVGRKKKVGPLLSARSATASVTLVKGVATGLRKYGRVRYHGMVTLVTVDHG